MSHLFSSAKLGKLELNNRIVIAPMCQYSAEEGYPTQWHTMHYAGTLALSGASVLIFEATAVEAEGRISVQDLGLWSDSHAEAILPIIRGIRRYSPIKLGIQLAHAGRKASVELPWQGSASLALSDGGWQTIAPSALAFKGYSLPQAMSKKRIEQFKASFVAAAKRAVEIGFELIEIHAAHGYLLHEFLSPEANQRTDEYGGTLENRLRLLLELFTLVRNAITPEITLGVRISATDWLPEGWDIDQSIELAKQLDRLGCDYIHISSGGMQSDVKIPIGPNYQVPFAQQIKQQVKMPVIAVGLITEPEQAEAIIATGQADFIALGRGILYEPRWPWHAAIKLGVPFVVPPQYLASIPRRYHSLIAK